MPFFLLSRFRVSKKHKDIFYFLSFFSGRYGLISSKVEDRIFNACVFSFVCVLDLIVTVISVKNKICG